MCVCVRHDCPAGCPAGRPGPTGGPEARTHGTGPGAFRREGRNERKVCLADCTMAAQLLSNDLNNNKNSIEDDKAIDGDDRNVIDGDEDRLQPSAQIPRSFVNRSSPLSSMTQH